MNIFCCVFIFRSVQLIRRVVLYALIAQNKFVVLYTGCICKSFFYFILFFFYFIITFVVNVSGRRCYRTLALSHLRELYGIKLFCVCLLIIIRVSPYIRGKLSYTLT